MTAKPKIEESIAKMQAIVASLQAGSLPLDKLIAEYKTGAALARSIQAQLKMAEIEIREVSEETENSWDEIQKRVEQIAFLAQGPDKSTIIKRAQEALEKLKDQ